MNIAEYRQKLLDAGFWYVGPAVEKIVYLKDDPTPHSALDEPLTNGGELKQYGIMYVRILKNGKYQTVIQTFLVKNVGTTEEEISPIAQELENEPETTNAFRDLVRSYLDATHISPAIPKITIDSINEIDEFAIVTAYEVTNNTVTPKKYFLYRDANGDPVFMEFVG